MPVPNVIIDGLNVCFVGREPSWDRLVGVVEAWKQQHRQSVVLAIADTSIRDRLSRYRRAIEQAESERWLELATGDADVTILSEAEEFGASVVSSDNYVAHRDEFEWVQGCDDRFFTPIWRKEHVEFQPRSMGISQPHEIAAAKKADDQKARRSKGRGNVLLVCQSAKTDCMHSGELVTPVYENGLPRCPQCWDECVDKVPDTQPAPEVERRLQLLTHQNVTAHIALTASGVSVEWSDGRRHSEPIMGRLILGRGRSEAEISITSGLVTDEKQFVSRSHLEIAINHAGRLSVRSLPALDGAVTLHNPDWQAGKPVSGRMVPGSSYPLKTSDELVVGIPNLVLTVTL